MEANVAPWLTRCGSWLRLTRAPIDVLEPWPPLDASADDNDVAASVWLAWKHLKRHDRRDWIWMLETMELLDLLARVDNAAAWTLVLDTLGQRELLPPIVGGQKRPRFRYRAVFTDRVFSPQSWVMNDLARGDLLPSVETHTPAFAAAKDTLLQHLPSDFQRDAATRIPLWVVQDPEDMHRWADRTMSFLTGIAALAEWWFEYQQVLPADAPLVSFVWTRLSLDVHDMVTLDRMAPTLLPRLTHFGLEIDLMTPTTELARLLDETYQLASTGRPGGVRTLMLIGDMAFAAYARACEVLYERRGASGLDVLYCSEWCGKESSETQEQRWEWLTLALFCEGETATARRRDRVSLCPSRLSDAHVAAVERVISDPYGAFAGLKGTSSRDTFPAPLGEIRPLVVPVNHLKMSFEETMSVDTVCRFLRAVAPHCHRLEINLPYRSEVENQELIRAALSTAPLLQRLDIYLNSHTCFAWPADVRTTRLRVLVIDCILWSGGEDSLLGLFEILSDVDHPLSHHLQRLQLSWSLVEPVFPAMLAMLVCNRRLDRCVISDLRPKALTDQRLAAFKGQQKPVVRQQGPLQLRAKLAFLSAVRRRSTTSSSGLYEGLAVAVVTQIFGFAAESKRRQCLVLERTD